MKPSFLIPALLFIVSRQASAEIADVWVVDDGTKVKATDTDHPLASGNGVFTRDAPAIELFGARNETVAFQVIVEGGASETAGVSVHLDQVGEIRNGTLSSDMDFYFVNRRIEIFREHYFEITQRSHDLEWVSGTDAEPLDLTGWIPDALVPWDPPKVLAVPAGRNQGFWVDLYIPKDTPVGLHEGLLTVEVGGSACELVTCQLPVRLRVIDLNLPDEPTAKTMLFFSSTYDDADQWPSRYFADPWSADADQLEAYALRHYKLARRHRITLFNSGGDDPSTDATLEERMSGSAFTREQGYEGPGEGVGLDMYSIHTYGGNVSPAAAEVWMEWFADHAPAVEYFDYVTDEPDTACGEVNSAAEAMEPFPTFVTSEPVDCAPNIDIFCVHPQEWDSVAAAAATSGGRRVWIYNGVRPHTGTFVSDDVAISPRVNPWIQYARGIPRWFLWESTYYHDFQGSDEQVDVFEEPISYSNSWGDESNSGGLMFYPGRDLLFPESDQQIDHPLPSIRLKNWRRGIEDVEYLVAAADLGRESLVSEVVDGLIPRVLDDLGDGDAAAWPEDGETWLAARRRLAELFMSTETGGTGGNGSGGAAEDTAGAGGETGGAAPEAGGTAQGTGGEIHEMGGASPGSGGSADATGGTSGAQGASAGDGGAEGGSESSGGTAGQTQSPSDAGASTNAGDAGGIGVPSAGAAGAAASGDSSSGCGCRTGQTSTPRAWFVACWVLVLGCASRARRRCTAQARASQ